MLPIMDVIFPLAIAFRVPPDGPPFSESLLPLVGVISIIIGSIGFAIFAFTKQHKTGGLKAYCYFMALYGVLALIVWMVFFGSRFFRHFPVSEFSFYFQWIMFVLPHLVWLAFIFYALRHLNEMRLHSE